MYEIKKIKFVYFFIILPVLCGFFWHLELESIVIAYIVFNLALILGFLQPYMFRKED